MSDRLWRSSSDRELDEDLDEDFDVRGWPVPGKMTVTARLASRAPAMVFRVASAAAARELAASMGPRDGNGVSAGADVAVERAAGSSGSSLPGDLRSRFEASLGADLSGVRVHTGAASAQAAGAVGAHAYTTGQDIHFAAGTYDPSSAFGVHLLAHEVAHTVQQQGAAPRRQHKLEVSGPEDSAEVEADRAADAMVAGRQAEVSAGPTIAARKPSGAAAIKVTVIAPVSAGNPIVFDAVDYRELYRQISERAATSKCAGQCDCGKLGCNYTTKGTTGTPEQADDVVEATFTTKITTSTPTWKQRATAKPEEQQKFDAWVASVAAHEAGHVKIYTEGLAKLKTAVTGPKDTDCDAQSDAIVAAYNLLQVQFDATSQPAPLPAPGGTTKIGPDGKETPISTDGAPAAEPVATEA